MSWLEPMKPIDFWFSIGSTYTYLTVMRIQSIGRDAGLEFDWRPFSVRKLMEEMGNVPFVGKPVKERYMWRDVQRQAEHYGFPVSLPVEYPLKHFDLANRIAIVAKQEGWCAEYVTMTYRLWFQDGVAAGSEANLDRCLQETNHSRTRVIDLANSDEIKTAYEEATDEARSLGIFGSPTFVVGDGEIFWGNDRLEDAVRWALRDSDPA